ncbi:50S ribosomal protein L37ae [Candidatus Micrarchaeota archaeon]|nr:50S ribosomal protein L37ae [Candidatus Micrarchaeota archaeon]
MGSRYGVTIRQRERKVLKQKNAKYECPKCGKKAVKRRGNARWECRSCGAIIAGGAYSPETAIGSATRKTIESLRQSSH